VKRAIVTMLVAIACGCASAPREPARGPQGALRVGVARIDITPEEPLRLTGYGGRTAPFDSVAQRLWAKALAFDDGRSAPAVLVTSDLIGVSRRMTEEVAARLAGAGVERGRFALTSTHTHTGPALAGVLPYIFSSPMPADQRQAVERYSAQLTQKLEQVARAALADRRPARLAWTAGRAGFAANRRVLKDGKWTGFGVNPDGPVDHDLPVLAVRGPDDSLRAVLVGYACHATTLEGKHNFVHGDWPGLAQQLIEQRHPGVVALVTAGTGADANPNPRGGLPDVERHAREIDQEVARLLQAPMRPIGAAPAGRFQYLTLDFAPAPPRAEWEARAARKDADGQQARAILDQLGRGERIAADTPYPVQTWTFGDELAMVFLGGEVVADYGLRLERELDAARLWVTAYANDVAFYVASRRMIAEGGYEVDRSMVYYGQPSRLAESTEERIIAAVREMLARRFDR
jgi:hypothetical protein